jgi:hypothetical protein
VGERDGPVMPSVWAWQDQAAHRALRSGDLAMIPMAGAYVLGEDVPPCQGCGLVVTGVLLRSPDG